MVVILDRMSRSKKVTPISAFFMGVYPFFSSDEWNPVKLLRSDILSKMDSTGLSGPAFARASFDHKYLDLLELRLKNRGIFAKKCVGKCDVISTRLPK